MHRFSSPSLIVIMVTMLIIFDKLERASCQRNCLLLTPPAQCIFGGTDAACGGPCFQVNCEAIQPGSTCRCSDGSTGPATNCPPFGTVTCNCVVDCSRIDPDATCAGGVGSTTSCDLGSGDCTVDCLARGQFCSSVPGFESGNTNDACSLTLGGSCPRPTTTAAPTTTTTAPTTTTTAPTTTTTAPTTTTTAPTAMTTAPTATTAAASYSPYLPHQFLPYYLIPPKPFGPSSSYPQSFVSYMNQYPYPVPSFMPYNTPYQPYPFFYNPPFPYVSQRSPLYEPDRYGFRRDNRPYHHQSSPYSRHSNQPRRFY